MITSLYSLSRRRSEYRLVIPEPEATNCFSINFQVFTKNNQHTFTSEKILVKILCVDFRYKIVCLHNLNFTHGGVSRVDEANSFPNKARKV